MLMGTARVLLCVALLLAAAQAATVNLTHCVMVLTATTAQVQYGAFAAKHFAANFPHLSLDVTYVGIYEAGGSSLRGVLRNFAYNGTDCDVVIGPGSSNFATAINPLINSAWCDFGSATTDLSSRFDYPLFNRMIPSTATAAAAGGLFLQQMGWNQINVLCANSAYAVSFSTVISANLGPNGIAYVNDCIDNAAPYETVLALLQQFMASRTRVIVVVASISDPIFFSIIQALQATNATQTHIVLASEAFTVGTNTAYLTIPGLFSVSYAQNASLATAFLAEFALRNLTEYVTPLEYLGFPVASIADTYSLTAAWAADCSTWVLTSLDRYVALYGALPPNPTLTAEWMRNQTVYGGLTGTLTAPDGDRAAPVVTFLNTLTDGTAVPAANFSNGTLTVAPSVFVMGETYAASDVPPGIPVTPPAPAAPPYWAIGVALGVAVVLLVPTALWARQRRLKSVRPLDGARPLAVMFVGVKNEANVHDAGPQNAAAALARVAAVVRRNVRAHGCFEARRVNQGTVMVVAKDASRLLRCATAINEELEAQTPWVTEVMVFEDLHECRESRHVSRSKSRSVSTRGTHSRHSRHSKRTEERHAAAGGLSERHPRINIGMHFGFGMIDHDEDNDTVSYHGAAVVRAAAVADAAVAGQIAVSKEFVEALHESGEEDVGGRFVEMVGVEDGAVLSYVPPHFAPERTAAIEKQWGEGGDAAGSVSAALAGAEVGLTARRIAMTSISVPWLTVAGEVRPCVDALADIAEIVRENRGELLGVQDSRLLVAVNAGGTPVSMAAARAAAIALRVVDYADRQPEAKHGGASASAGIASGTALVGSTTGDAAGSRICLGAVSTRAEQMRLVGVGLGVACCATDASLADLAPRFRMCVADYVQLPPAPYFTRVIALLDEIDTAGPGEWLYAVGGASTAADEQWASVAAGKLPAVAPPAAADATTPSAAPQSDGNGHDGAAEALRQASSERLAAALARISATSPAAYASARYAELTNYNPVALSV